MGSNELGLSVVEIIFPVVWVASGPVPILDTRFILGWAERPPLEIQV